MSACSAATVGDFTDWSTITLRGRTTKYNSLTNGKASPSSTERLLDPGYFSRTASTESASEGVNERTEQSAAMDSETNVVGGSTQRPSPSRSTNTSEDITTTAEAPNEVATVTQSASTGSSTGSTGAAGCGPDQVVGAESLWTCHRECPVRLRIGTANGDDIAAHPPVSVVTAFRRTVIQHGERLALATNINGAAKSWTFRQYYSDVWSAAKAFIKLGLQPYHGVGIIGFNSPEWFISNVAAIFAGGLSTGFYTTNLPEACHFVADSAQCNVIVVEDESQLQKIRQIWDRLPELKAVVQYRGTPTVVDATAGTSSRPVYSWNEFMKLSESVPDAALEERISQQAINKCCTLIYTSGTTGNSKGVMLSQDNHAEVETSTLAIHFLIYGFSIPSSLLLLWTAESASRSVGFTTPGEIIVSYLPLSHIAAQIIDIFVPILFAHTVHFARPDALKGSLGDTLREVRPTAFFGVPRVWEKIQEKMTSLAARQNFIQRTIMNLARSIGLRGNLSVMNGGSVPYGWWLANAVVFNKVRVALGLDRCRLCLTSAAPITRDTLEFFMSLDITLLELYGMSESSGPHTMSRPARFRLSSVGTAMEGVTLHIDNPDEGRCGEVCMLGRNVFMGYLDEEAKTQETIDDQGRLHSGDVGKVDADGFLYITGRIKELLITAGGENVAPVPIEDAVKLSIPCISNCMVIGDRRKFLSILLTLKTEANSETSEPTDQLSKTTVEWFQTAGCRSTLLTVTDVLEACNSKDESVKMAIQTGINQANRLAPSRAQNIQKWTILPRDFSISGGELGPTLKLKRPVVLQMYDATINAMYVD